MIQPHFTATIQHGALTLKNEALFKIHLQRFKEGEEVLVSVNKKTRTRTLPQNSYYWAGVLPIIADFTGHSTDELHEIFKHKFLPKKFILWKGKEYQTSVTTTTLSTTEFSEYIEKIKMDVSSLDIHIPEAHELDLT